MSRRAHFAFFFSLPHHSVLLVCYTTSHTHTLSNRSKAMPLCEECKKERTQMYPAGYDPPHQVATRSQAHCVGVLHGNAHIVHSKTASREMDSRISSAVTPSIGLRTTLYAFTHSCAHSSSDSCFPTQHLSSEAIFSARYWRDASDAASISIARLKFCSVMVRLELSVVQWSLIFRGRLRLCQRGGEHQRQR